MSETAYDAEFDYVIVGAGSAGAALAHRLSESGDHSVRVLEYGGSDNSIFIKMPTAFSIPMNMKRYDWGFHSEKEPGLKGRSLHQARGKVLGGSSSINGLVYVRGCAGDFEEWEELGAAGWGYQDVLPYFKRGEDCVYGGDAYRGDQGGLTTCNGNNMKNPLYRAFIKAGEQAGYGYTEDYNGYRQEGFGRMDMTVRDGVRCSTAMAYLKPAMNRPNLDIQTHALTTRVIMDGKTAVGVEYRQGGKTRRVRARKEVILSASSFNSPKLLMLSGIGPADHLKEHGIEVVHDLPGVGRNLQDHLEVWVQQECTQKITLNSWLGPLAKAWIGANWLFLKRGLGTSNQFESNGYIRSRAGMKYPDIQFHFLAGAIAYDGSSAFKGHGFQVHLGANKPKSRGWVKLKSADPEAPPEIVFNYFAEEEDKEAFRAGLRWTREIFAQPALDEYRGKEVSPGPDVQTDAQIDQWLAETAETAYHPAGSCRMGTDAMAVVDPECRVHGVRNLRVVDSSIMPTVTNGNLNAPTIMIGEKAADHILGRTPLRSDAPSFAPDDWQTSQRVSAPERTV
ncbi:choline dehydrogenase [Alloalcanivorax venustensis]|jgi:choline dehydrogenase|uniref:Choline dehydrogenase n=1 Tax=Alloalcanivorax venustensis ISO4 TaxID=1177184 RepID=A0ABS0ABY5_9GAMM|nr:choline dehydrogenase [Alloalcanivorax venustensis]MBF5051559.1 choline dehydrogenase [Alloalcanivorax venustensis ISO4]SMO39094.1 choline dehydrogenase [Alcanivorax sp. DSM 26295]HAJ41442.1 choline dehydrogenase [Alcanivorax sp.]|tara:strand:+ start:546 stop:2237 length:1692 start_codon:yes stop_codon:yes gene_type:complete